MVYKNKSLNIYSYARLINSRKSYDNPFVLIPYDFLNDKNKEFPISLGNFIAKLEFVQQ